MPISSDLNINFSKFDPSAVSQKTKDLNNDLINVMSGIPRWYEVGAERYRQMRANGETPLPLPVKLPQAKIKMLPSRDAGREIPCRIMPPKHAGQAKGVYYHIHGGGWVLQDEASQDPLLEFIADTFNLTVISLGYRLAPENPFPAGPNDCYDVAEWLVDNAEAELGSPMVVAGGESAGGHLASLVCFHLLRNRPHFSFKALLLTFGAYDLSTFLPQTQHFQKPLVLTGKIMEKYIEVFIPNTTAAQRTDPAISPFFENLYAIAKKSPTGRLPPALFTVGTEDPLLDDSIVMASKWQMSGAEGPLKVYPGAPHGFTLFDPKSSEASAQWREDVKEFFVQHLL